ncbi:MAG: hypothetical protein KatS3mg013_0213 [Actinomycetota bacterium]|nr:MAG: hypothetical protein KatS3mg013_0213 [Actinomycetota bacterium]
MRSSPRILGGEHRPFDVPRADPAVIVVAGVQGSGKTTACAKLARHLKANGRRPVLIGADLERPAAVGPAAHARAGDRRPRLVPGP